MVLQVQYQVSKWASTSSPVPKYEKSTSSTVKYLTFSQAFFQAFSGDQFQRVVEFSWWKDRARNKPIKTPILILSSIALTAKIDAFFLPLCLSTMRYRISYHINKYQKYTEYYKYLKKISINSKTIFAGNKTNNDVIFLNFLLTLKVGLIRGKSKIHSNIVNSFRSFFSRKSFQFQYH